MVKLACFFHYSPRLNFRKITRIEPSIVEKIPKHLKNAQQIAQQKTSKFRIVTMLNRQNCQTGAQQNTHQMHNNCTSSAQQVHTYKNDKNVKNDKKHMGCVFRLKSQAFRINSGISPILNDRAQGNHNLKRSK